MTAISRVGFVLERHGLYDLIWVARTHNLRRVQDALRKAGVRAPIVLDTEAVASNREAARAALAGEAFDFSEALAAEFEGLVEVKTMLAVNEAEAKLLRKAGRTRVSVLGTVRAPDPTSAGFAAREGLLFVGAIHQQGAPNQDSLRFYVRYLSGSGAADARPANLGGGGASGGGDRAVWLGHGAAAAGRGRGNAAAL